MTITLSVITNRIVTPCVSHITWLAWAWSLALLSATLVGCGSEEMRGRITGKITFRGQPVSEGMVLLCNNAKGIHMTARLKPDGRYEITTAKGVGLPVGAYQVCVCPPLMEPNNDMHTAPKIQQYPNIPKKYRDYKTSDLTLNVQEGENSFDVEMKP